MTAPAAPHILARDDGTRVWIRWQPVANADFYTVYVKEGAEPYGVEDTVDDTEVNPDGWFMDYTGPLAGVVTVKLTATNLAVEESAFSNEVQMNLTGGGNEVLHAGPMPMRAQ